MPQALQDRPVLPDVLEDYLNAFFQLDLKRQHTMGAELPIPASEIIAFANIFGFEVDMQFFYRCISEMDSESFMYRAERNKQKAAQTKKPPTSRPPARPARRR